ncbi:DUF2628 domain-containing protein [Bradyrhizobium sp. SYSU BS000235]|uniref:DUF2628 domain-containing protein n=1 Tax=Bradyrhizobium sp. SYSU BS000235 TaxID=3411332 RepID=UPI003C70DFBB
MAVYTVHAPASYGVDVRTTSDRVVFVRDGFYFWAFVLSFFWLIWHRLWLALFGYVVISIASTIVLRSFGLDFGARAFVALIIALLIGLEAGSLRRWKLSRRKWRQLDVVVAKNEEEAERRFFDRWAEHAARDDRGNGPLHPMPHASLTSQQDVIGLFPEPGVSR